MPRRPALGWSGSRRTARSGRRSGSTAPPATARWRRSTTSPTPTTGSRRSLGAGGDAGRRPQGRRSSSSAGRPAREDDPRARTRTRDPVPLDLPGRAQGGDGARRRAGVPGRPGDPLTQRTLPLFFEVLRVLVEGGVTVVAEAALSGSALAAGPRATGSAGGAPRHPLPRRPRASRSSAPLGAPRSASSTRGCTATARSARTLRPGRQRSRRSRTSPCPSLGSRSTRATATTRLSPTCSPSSTRSSGGSATRSCPTRATRTRRRGRPARPRPSR